MWIKSDERDILINSNLVSEFNIIKSTKFNNYAILAQCMGITKPIIIADYELQRTAQSALDLIYEELKEGADYMLLPEDGDIRLTYSDGIVHGQGSFAKKRSHTTGKTK